MSQFEKTIDSCISPVLCNMTLDGLEPLLNQLFKRCKVNFIRFADDFITTADSKERLETQITPVIEQFLLPRGLTLSKEKTRICSIEDGFDFLGFNIRKYNGKLIIKPSKKNIKNLLSKLKAIFNKNKSAKPINLIRQLNPVLRGWTNYFKHVCSKTTFRLIDQWLGKRLYKWLKRKHPKKSYKWIKSKYLQPPNSTGSWQFTAYDRKSKAQLYRASSVPIQRHVKIQSEANPYDPKFELYFENRVAKSFKSGQYGSKTASLWNRQKGLCPHCDELIDDQDDRHIHHIVYRCQGGMDTLDNLALLHPVCHRQLHACDSL